MAWPPPVVCTDNAQEWRSKLASELGMRTPNSDSACESVREEALKLQGAHREGSGTLRRDSISNTQQTVPDTQRLGAHREGSRTSRKHATDGP